MEKIKEILKKEAPVIYEYDHAIYREQVYKAMQQLSVEFGEWLINQPPVIKVSKYKFIEKNVELMDELFEIFNNQ